MSQEITPVAKRKSTINRFCLLALAILVLLGCDRADFRSGFVPGEVETIDNAKVYHLADGVFIAQRKDGSNVYYLIESTVADYELTAEGLDIKLDDEKATRGSITPAPEGYVAAWLTEIPPDGPGVTRLKVDDTRLAELLQDLTATTTARDIYNLKQ
jgi:hypothetical protein